MSYRLATLIGFSAILVWSTLAALTVLSDPVPPFLLNAITCGIGGLAGLVWTMANGRMAVLRQVPLGVILFGSIGLFGYHALYYAAFRMVPPAQASLLNYLWPLLIVLFSGFLPGEKLRAGHVIGALIGFAGAVTVLWNAETGFAAIKLGHLLAIGCAVFWAVYSVVSRRISYTPTESVALFCLGNAAMSFAAHFLFETAAWPSSDWGWLSMLLIGLGPAGLAFFVWDIGMKHGDIRLLAAASYAAPILSTLLLIAIGSAVMSLQLAIAVVLITGGAAISLLASRAAQRNGAKAGETS